MAGKQNDSRMCLPSYLYAHNASDKALQYVSLLCQTFSFTKITWLIYHLSCFLHIRQNNWQSWHNTSTFNFRGIKAYIHYALFWVRKMFGTESKLGIKYKYYIITIQKLVLMDINSKFQIIFDRKKLLLSWGTKFRKWKNLSCFHFLQFWVIFKFNFLQYDIYQIYLFWSKSRWHKCVHRRVNGADNWWLRDQYSAANVISPQGDRD